MECERCRSRLDQGSKACSNCGHKPSVVRSQVFEVIIRQAIAGAPWREICSGPMLENNITAEEVESEIERRKVSSVESPSSSNITFRWNPFPARKLIAVGALCLVLSSLLIIGNQKDFQYLLFAFFVMILLEGCVDILEEKQPVKTGIFESKLKYFLFLNGGAASVWFALRTLLPQGMTDTASNVLWICLALLLFLTAKPAASAATSRVLRTGGTQWQDDDASDT